MKIHSLLLFVTLLALTGCSGADAMFNDSSAPADRGYRVEMVNHRGNLRRYGVFVPHADPPPSGYPVIVFLHGLGEGGSDGRRCASAGLGPAIAKRTRTFPFVAVFPQVGNWSDNADAVAMAALDDVLASVPCDRERVSVTGLSTGGAATWRLAGKHSDVFAAAVPIAAYAQPRYAEPIARNMPVWVWHNAADWAVPSGHSNKMVELLEKHGGDVRYTKRGSLSHDVWVKAYDDDLFDWLLAQRR